MFIFYHVAKQASFSSAAKHLGLSRSMITQAIGHLEKTFSVQLFHRTTRTFILTEQGNKLFAYAQRMNKDFEEAYAELRSVSNEPKGKIAIQIPGVLLDVPAVHEILSKFMEDNPRVTFDITSQDRVGDMVGGHVDVALHVGPLEDSSYYYKEIHHFDTYILGSPEYFIRHPKPEHPSELEKHPVFNYRHCLTGDKWIFLNPQTKEKQGFPIGKFTTVDTERLLVSFAESGRGISSALDISCADQLNQGKLVPILENWTYQIPLQIVYVSKKMPKSLKMLIDVLVKELPKALAVDIRYIRR